MAKTYLVTLNTDAVKELMDVYSEGGCRLPDPEMREGHDRFARESGVKDCILRFLCDRWGDYFRAIKAVTVTEQKEADNESAVFCDTEQQSRCGAD